MLSRRPTSTPMDHYLRQAICAANISTTAPATASPAAWTISSPKIPTFTCTAYFQTSETTGRSTSMTSRTGPAGSAFHTSIRRPNLQIADLALGGNQVFNHSFLHYQIAVGPLTIWRGGRQSRRGLQQHRRQSRLRLQSRQRQSANTVPSSPATSRATRPPTQANTQLSDIDLTTGQATQLNLQAGAAMGINYHLGTHASTFEFGGAIPQRAQRTGRILPNYDNRTMTPPMTPFLGTFTNPHFYGGSYHLPPVTKFDSPHRPTLPPTQVRCPSMKGRLTRNPTPPTTTCRRESAAGYIMNTIEFGSRFHLQTGLRIEGNEHVQHRISGREQRQRQLWRNDSAIRQRLLCQSAAKRSTSLHHR